MWWGHIHGSARHDLGYWTPAVWCARNGELLAREARQVTAEQVAHAFTHPTRPERLRG